LIHGILGSTLTTDNQLVNNNAENKIKNTSSLFFLLPGKSCNTHTDIIPVLSINFVTDGKFPVSIRFVPLTISHLKTVWPYFATYVIPIEFCTLIEKTHTMEPWKHKNCYYYMALSGKLWAGVNNTKSISTI
jgi:hypothetical protein